MGVRELTPAVADAGPLIHLAEIDCLGFLSLFEPLLVANLVWQEAERHGASAVELAKITSLKRVTVHHEEIDSSEIPLPESGGEREALFVCHAESVAILLTDDLAVRAAARRVGVLPVGSLGVVVRASRQGLCSESEAEALLIALHERSSLFVTRVIVELAIESLRSRHHV